MTPYARSFSFLLVFAACGGAANPPASPQQGEASSDAGAGRDAGAARDSGTSPLPHLPDVASVRTDLHCTQKSDGEEAACTSKGCSLGPPLFCMGTPPGRDIVQENQRRYDASADRCTCTCEIDIKRCSEVP